ncbi:hypothetical protein T459_02972 [Capsicum annuum]|uniref:Zinc finger PMZ-type domain-containing protein n=1 Tax=Capsicum annuum TaxID=4072 RepID=A0A2G3ALK1_CAPAN|nr:hypothetical protein T459_02972 [Capsicum annuum]
MREWVETPKYWKWRSFTKVTILIPIRRNSLYDKFVASVMQSRDLDCAPSDVVISYLMHSREKVNPTIINSDVRMLTYIMDADADRFSHILRINVVERSFKGPLNSSAPPSWRLTVNDDLINDDLNNYENGGDYPINVEDDFMHMEDFLSDSQDDEEDRGTVSQPGYSFSDEINFCCGQTFADKEELKMLLDAVTNRAHFSGNRYDVMTTNIAIRSILMDEREYPVSYIFNSIAKKFGEKFRERHTFVDGKKNIFVPYAERILRDNKRASDSLYVSNPNGVLDQYTVFENSATANVNLLKRSRSCRKFNLVKMSCEHAMVALREKYGDGEGYGNFIYDYYSPMYKAESYLLAYSEAINVVPPEAEGTVPQELLDTKISPPSNDPKLERKKF